MTKHFSRTDPHLLGETLVLGAQLCFAQGIIRTLTYECNGQWLRFESGGSPFRVDVIEIETDKPIFNLFNTGDGLTYVFSTHDHKPVTKLILNAAKEYFFKLQHQL